MKRTVRSENENWRTLYQLREYLPQNEAGRFFDELFFVLISHFHHLVADKIYTHHKNLVTGQHVEMLDLCPNFPQKLFSISLANALMKRTVRSENENWRTFYQLREYLPQNEAGSQRLAVVVSERGRILHLMSPSYCYISVKPSVTISGCRMGIFSVLLIYRYKEVAST
jgi:hypothetical protein